MTGQLIWAPTLIDEIPNSQYGTLREDRIGVMLHFDGSGSDRGALQWFKDARCRVSYNLLVLDDGSYVRIAPDSARAWHAGRCRPSDPSRLHYGDANSAFFGLAIASSGEHDVTPLQMLTVALLCRLYFEKHHWDLSETWRIVSHSSEAWGRGRKTDPEGADPKNPILSVDDIRQLLPKVSRA
ncbi:MAG: peptidoglycan recognition family protein [Gemmatimonadota bacterium]